MCTEWPIKTLKTAGAKQIKIRSVTNVPELHISVHFTLPLAVLWDTGHFEICAPNDPKMNFHYKVNGDCCVLPCPKVPNFSSLCFTTNLFRARGHFGEKCTKLRQNDREYYMGVTTELHVSLHFPLNSAFIKAETILRKVQRIIQKWYWTQQRQSTPCKFTKFSFSHSQKNDWIWKKKMREVNLLQPYCCREHLQKWILNLKHTKK